MTMKPMSAYRARATRALGRPLARHEHVHHHSKTQLVVCDAAYHHWLHARMREKGVATPKYQGQCYIVRNIDPVLLWRVKVAAAQRGISIRQVIITALEEFAKSANLTS